VLQPLDWTWSFISCYAHACTNVVHIVYICKEILPPLDNATIEFRWIMALEIEDVGLWNQVCEDETIDQFHNIIQVCIQGFMLCKHPWVEFMWNVKYETSKIRKNK
jgi:hypothetical protein